MGKPDFRGLRVLVLESRRSRELAALVSTYGGVPLAAPAMREIPIENNPDALAFADGLVAGRFDVVIFLTGVGTRALLDVVDHAGKRAEVAAALARAKVAVRGPKPLAAVRELKIEPMVVAPEPNTWRELLAALDAKGDQLPMSGARVAVQEYGAPNPELLQGLEARGAIVTSVPVYRYALPDDLEPLRAGIAALTHGEIDVVLLTTGTQIVHLLQVARTMEMSDAVREGLAGAVVCSIGPSTSAELRTQGVSVDLEASHPKMGFLVREAAEHAGAILARRRGG